MDFVYKVLDVVGCIIIIVCYSKCSQLLKEKNIENDVHNEITFYLKEVIFCTAFALSFYLNNSFTMAALHGLINLFYIPYKIFVHHEYLFSLFK
ncbi:MAG: hypothetical protein RLZZ418_290 [Pseudomonadota bacterium]|jgi:hypothetical protein